MSDCRHSIIMSIFYFPLKQEFWLQVLLYIIFPLTIDFIRAIYGPLNEYVCYIGVLFKTVISINCCLTALVMTITKYVFVLIYKSIPIMDDNCLSRIIYMTINMISIMATLIRLYLPGRPVITYVIFYFKVKWFGSLCG